MDLKFVIDFKDNFILDSMDLINFKFIDYLLDYFINLLFSLGLWKAASLLSSWPSIGSLSSSKEAEGSERLYGEKYSSRCLKMCLEICYRLVKKLCLLSLFK